MQNQMTGQEWQRYFNKVEKTKKIIATTLDVAEQKLAKRLAEEREALINEATRIATEIIERERKSEGKFTVTGNDTLIFEEKISEVDESVPVKPAKPKIELNEENIKILQQVKEIQATKTKERKKEKEQKQKQKKKEDEELEKGKKIVEERLKQTGAKEWTG